MESIIKKGKSMYFNIKLQTLSCRRASALLSTLLFQKEDRLYRILLEEVLTYTKERQVRASAQNYKYSD
jgi:hypothetical protein